MDHKIDRKTVRTLAKDKEFRPYFIRYLKASFEMPKIIVSLIGPINDTKTLESLIEYQRALEALKKRLEKQRFSSDQTRRVVGLVSEYLMAELGEKAIRKSTPELLILEEDRKN